MVPINARAQAAAPLARIREAARPLVRASRPICDHERLDRLCEGRQGAEDSLPLPPFSLDVGRKPARNGEERSAPGEIRTPDLRLGDGSSESMSTIIGAQDLAA
jgi:hypothetical protein